MRIRYTLKNISTYNREYSGGADEIRSWKDKGRNEIMRFLLIALNQMIDLF